MAGVKFQKGSPEWYMFQDYWKLCQKYWIPESSDEYWDQMNVEISGFMGKYEDIALARELGSVLVTTLDSQYRKEAAQK